MGKEASLWKWLRSNALPCGHYSRIESETSAGFPDTNYCIQGCEGNLELKVARHAKSKYPFKRGGLRTTQIAWMIDRVENKGRVVLLAQVKNDLYFFRIINARSLGLSLNYMTLDQMNKAADSVRRKTKRLSIKDVVREMLVGKI